MQSKKSQRVGRSGSQGVPPRFPWRWLMIAAVVVLAGVVAVRLVMRSQSHPRIGERPTSIGANFEATPSSGDTAWDSSWPALPQSGKPARPIEAVRAAYAYAVRREDVLRYMPCYCGCEKQGHRSNHDCFVRGKTAAGAPAWDPMGYT